MRLVAINRDYVARSLLFALLLLWPLLIFGRPAYMVDSAAYQKGGERAASFALEKLHLTPAVPEPRARQHGGAAAAVVGDGDETKVARSILYSVAGYIFSGPDLSMGYMAIFQALCVGLVFTALFEAIVGPSWIGFVAMAFVTTFMTTLAPITMFIIPDCFAAILLGIMMIVPFYWARFSWPMRLLLLLLGIFSVAVHDSHPPLAVGTALVASIGLLLFRTRRSGKFATAARVLWIPAVLGLLLVVAAGLVGFGKAGFAPKRHPLALARAIENGPARWYLQDSCRNTKAYAMCEIYGRHIPATAYEILWAPDNVVVRASPRQLDRVRAEEWEILIRSTLRYPAQQAYFIFRDMPLQFVTFRLDYLKYGSNVVRDGKGDVALANPGTGGIPRLYRWLDWINAVTLVVAMAGAIRLWRSMTMTERAVVSTLVAGLLVNAAVCAIFSGVAARYQARLIWLVPYLMLAIAFASAKRRSPGSPIGVTEPDTD